jgi:hypothetical protein
MRVTECSSCGRQHNELKAYKSKLIIGTTFIMCPSCRAEKMEPRFAIILAGRSNGPNSVAEYVKNRRYIGNEILAKELIV